MMRQIAAAAAAAGLLFTAIQAQAAKTEFARPPFAGAYQPQGTDERGIWMDVDEEERSIRDMPMVIKDESLNNFVRGILCRTVGEDRCAAARIYVVQNAVMNASMYPNGAMLERRAINLHHTRLP